MILCAIDQDDHSVSPTRTSIIKLFDQLTEKEFHHTIVAIDLSKRVEDVAEGVDTQNHGDSWNDGQLRNRIRG